jgi:transaldolase / glucose-6-phosphate isomerase
VPESIVARIWARDHTVWQDDPTEVANRLGWLDSPVAMADRLPEFTALANQVRADGIDHVLLLGMGGSSLYPEVLAANAIALGAPGDMSLTVLDSTHPAAVARVRDQFDPDRTLVVASSKSGTTVETWCLLERFWEDLVTAHGVEAAGRHVVAITDPGSKLAALGEERGFRAVVTNPADIGGRFSALSAFGLVPAALLGIDLDAHLASARAMSERCQQEHDNPGVALGRAMVRAFTDGRWHLTVLLPDTLAGFGAWIEQLVAESTGKHGVGVLPVVDGAERGIHGSASTVVVYGGIDVEVSDDVPVVALPAVTAGDLAAEVFRWEFATAVAGAELGINPFDQPDVESAKTAATRMLEKGAAPPEPGNVPHLLADMTPDGYLAILAFVDPAGRTADMLPDVAARLRVRLRVPVTIGIGPRYLHSTGQLHKGGPDGGRFAVLLAEDVTDVAVPGRDHTFGQLLRAQAVGDLLALEGAGRTVALVALEDLDAAGR